MKVLRHFLGEYAFQSILSWPFSHGFYTVWIWLIINISAKIHGCKN